MRWTWTAAVVLGLASAACGGARGRCDAQSKCVSAEARPGADGPTVTSTSSDVGQVCVTRSEVGADGLGTIEVMVTPRGCISSSVHLDASSCTLSAAPAGGLTLAASFTFTAPGPDQPALADCSGGAFATCSLTGVAPGTTTITAGQTTLTLAVPRAPRPEGAPTLVIPNPQDCAGAPF